MVKLAQGRVIREMCLQVKKQCRPYSQCFHGDVGRTLSGIHIWHVCMHMRECCSLLQLSTRKAARIPAIMARAGQRAPITWYGADIDEGGDGPQQSAIVVELSSRLLSE